jgi:pilus assembly protein FimV
VWVKVKPRQVSEPSAREESFELADLEQVKTPGRPPVARADESGLTTEEELLLDELETELGPQEDTVAVPDEEPLLEEDADLPEIALGQVSDEELPELEEDLSMPETTDVEVTLSEDAPAHDRFDDLEALETELATVSSASKSPDASPTILARIEEELRSIRSDLTQLRSELSGLRQGVREPSEVESPSADSESPGGFFDEDEDETIALTGDELDNILNTAEITEEVSEAAPVEVDLTQDILGYEPASAEQKPAAPVEDNLDDALSLDDELSLPEELEELEEIEEIQELPAELVLDDLAAELKPAAATTAEEPLVMELEGIEEAEPASAGLAGDETIDLETLDLGEEPTVIEAVPEVVDELEAIEEATPMDADELAADVDLEALAAEAKEMDDDIPIAPSADDLDLAELESVADEQAPAASAADEIEIEFEPDAPASPREGRSTDADVEEGSLEEIEEIEEIEAESLEPLEEVLEAEEVHEPAPVAKPGSTAAIIPDNLKDEIKTVLKYMDQLLEALPDEKIQEFAGSEYFVMYKKLFEDLGLGE